MPDTGGQPYGDGAQIYGETASQTFATGSFPLFGQGQQLGAGGDGVEQIILKPVAQADVSTMPVVL